MYSNLKKLEDSTLFDVAIIGGGIVGAATLYKLQKRNPDLRIVLIEKEKSLGGNSAKASSGINAVFSSSQFSLSKTTP